MEDCKLCANDKEYNMSGSSADRKLNGDVNGGMVSVLSSALETDGDLLSDSI